MSKQKFGFKTILNEFLSAFNVERGFIPTVKDLIMRPEAVVHHYIEGKQLLKIYKEKYFLPGRFFVAVFAVIALFSLVIGDSMITPTLDSSSGHLDYSKTPNPFLDLVEKYSMFVVFLCGILPGTISTKILFFKRQEYSLAMHFIINVYLQCIVLLFTPIYFLFINTHEQYLIISMMAYIIYYMYAIKRIFKTSWIKAIVKSITLQIVAISLILMAVFVGALIYFLIIK